MKRIVTSAPGKLHFIGEHSVVYGYPAILTAINKRCVVSASDIKKNSHGKNLQNYVKVCTEIAFSYFKRSPLDSVRFSINSAIPIGSGMGGSASIAVCIAAAVSEIVTGKIDKEKINAIAFECEKYAHGNPSGGDNAVSTYGGFVWFQKNSDNKKTIRPLSFSFSKDFLSRFFIINTGKPTETTKEMVEIVKSQISNPKSQKKIKSIFEKQSKLTFELLNGLKKEDNNLVSGIIKRAEKNLEILGIVSASTKKLIRDIENSGGAAKVCGAGGMSGASGIVLVFNSDPKKVYEVASKYGFLCEKISLGEEGVRKDE